MGLFRRRPLCFFCFLFVLTSLLIRTADYTQKLATVIVAFFAAVLCTATVAVIKKYRYQAIYVLLSACFVLLAATSSFVRIDCEQKRAEKYVGERYTHMSVLSQSYSSVGTSVFTVRIDSIEGEDTSIKATLVCAFSLELEAGDRIFAYTELMDTGRNALGMTAEERSSDADIMLGAVIYDGDEVLVERFDRDAPFFERLFAKNGFLAMSADLKRSIVGRADNILGPRTGSLAKAVLLGDKTDVPTETIRDFRRSGVSHLFAVSGLHISIMLGIAELILRRLYVHKYARCAINSLLAFVLLLLTGFSMSALRAVLMLWIAYLIFIFSEQADSPTTLFLAVSVIILIFPYSVYELGMWMSFLATLGLVSVYPMLESRIMQNGKNKGRGPLALLLRAGRRVLLIAVMTVVCSAFLIPIQWRIFGEISLMSVFANVALSLLTPTFMVLCILSLALGSLAFVGDALVSLSSLVGDCILWVVKGFSSFDFAMLSFRYFFVDALVVLFIIATTVLLVVNLKRKLLVLVPIVAFSVAFSSCVAVFALCAPQRVVYRADGTREMLALTSSEKLCIVDMSNGAYFRYGEMLDGAAKYGATIVDKLVFTRLSSAHVSSMDYFLRCAVVKSIYMAYPETPKELELSKKMTALAEECDTQVKLYKNGEVIEHFGTSFCVYNTQSDGRISSSVFVEGEKELFGYVDAFADERVFEYIRQCDTVVIGNNGVPEKAFYLPVSEDAHVIYSSREIMEKSRLGTGDDMAYLNTKKSAEYTFSID